MHEVCHVEIATTDLAATGRFLNGLFEWTVTEMMREYWLWSAPEGPGGGLALVPKLPDPGAISIYVGVYAVGMALVRAVELGAEVRRPAMELPDGHGHCAEIRIPGGAVLGLWSRTA
jgi:predicted enzyme related to lactoylglutathione lyase